MRHPYKQNGQWKIKAPDGTIVNLQSTMRSELEISRRPGKYQKGPNPIMPVTKPPLPKSKPKTKGVGDFFAEDLRGVNFQPTSCNGCKKTMEKMNQLGPEGCEANKEELVKEVLKNAQSRSWLNKIKDLPAGVRLATKTRKATPSEIIAATLDKAINETKTQQSK